MPTETSDEDIIASVCSTFSTYNVLESCASAEQNAGALESTRGRIRKQCDTISNLLRRTASPLTPKNCSQERTSLSKLSFDQAIVLEHFLAGSCSLQSKDRHMSTLCCLSVPTEARTGPGPELSQDQVLKDASSCSEGFDNSVRAHYLSQQAKGKTLDKRYISNHKRKILFHLIHNRLPWLLTHVLSELRGRLLEITYPSSSNNLVSGITQSSELFGPIGVSPSKCLCNLQEFTVWIMHNGVMAIDACDAMEDIVCSSYSKYGNTAEALVVMKPYFVEVFNAYRIKSVSTPPRPHETTGVNIRNPNFTDFSQGQHSGPPSPATHLPCQKFWDKFRTRCIAGRVNVLTTMAMSIVFDQGQYDELTPLELRSATFRSFLGPIQAVVHLLKSMAITIDKLNQADVAHNSISPTNVYLSGDKNAAYDMQPISPFTHSPAVRFASFRNLRRFGTRLARPSRYIAEEESDLFDDAETRHEMPLPNPYFMAPEISEFLADTSPGKTFSFKNSASDVFGFGVVVESMAASLFGFAITKTYDPIHPTTPVGQKMRRRPDFLAAEYQPFENTAKALRDLVSLYFHDLEYTRRRTFMHRDKTCSSKLNSFGPSALQIAKIGEDIARKRLLIQNNVVIGSGAVEFDLDQNDFGDVRKTDLYSISTGFKMLQDSERIILQSLAKSAKADESTFQSYLQFQDDTTDLQRFIDPVTFAVALGNALDESFNASSLTAIHNALKNAVDCSAFSRKLGCKLMKLMIQCCRERPSRRPTPKIIIQSLDEIQADLDFMCK